MIQEQFKAFLESVATPENQTVIEAMVIGIKVIHESEGNAPFADLNGDVELTKEGAELIVDFKYTGNISEIPGIYENLQKSGYVDELTE